MTIERRPIGYWVKHLDRLLDGSLDNALAGEQLSRRHWQILNLLADHPADQHALTVALAPFLVVGRTEIADAVEDLRRRDWLSGGAELSLTEQGRLTHECILLLVSRMRQLASDGISAAEYATTVDVLQRMAGNLTAATSR